MITPQEREEIRQYFGLPLEELTPEAFKQLLRQLRAKYHPDQFEKFEDDTIKEVMTEKFQIVERLAARIEQYFQGQASLQITSKDDFAAPKYGFDKMKIEVITSDKDLKYHLFGASYRWLKFGERFKIPGSKASIIIDEDHAGHSIGFRETIRMYLTFGPSDDLGEIVQWLFERLEGRATSLIIEGKMIAIQFESMLNAIQRISLLAPV